MPNVSQDQLDKLTSTITELKTEAPAAADRVKASTQTVDISAEIADLQAGVDTIKSIAPTPVTPAVQPSSTTPDSPGPVTG